MEDFLLVNFTSRYYRRSSHIARNDIESAEQEIFNQNLESHLKHAPALPIISAKFSYQRMTISHQKALNRAFLIQCIATKTTLFNKAYASLLPSKKGSIQEPAKFMRYVG